MIDLVRQARDLADDWIFKPRRGDVERAVDAEKKPALGILVYRMIEAVEPGRGSAFLRGLERLEESRGDAADTARGESDAEKIERLAEALGRIRELAVGGGSDGVNLRYAVKTAHDALEEIR
jgi:hypothetical protein